MKTSDAHNLFALLACFDWWGVKTIHDRGRRGYLCEIRQRHGRDAHRTVYRATAAMPADAIRSCITKVQTRNKSACGVAVDETTLRDQMRPSLRLTEEGGA